MPAKIDMTGKTCVVCGGTTGIGFATCKGLAESGARVILTGTTQERADTAAKKLPGDCIGKFLDLTDFDSVRNFAQDLSTELEQLDVLINNAGLILPKREVNKEGIEKTFAVIYLGPFLLTHLLAPLIKKGQPTRIINVASDLHRRGKLEFDNLQSEKRYGFIAPYSNAELAKILWTRELAKRYETSQATVNCLHPGGVRTKLFRHFRGPFGWLLWLSDLIKIPPKWGARTSLYLATSPEVEKVTGEYYMEVITTFRGVTPSKKAQDEALGQALWDKSLELLDLKNQKENQSQEESP